MEALRNITCAYFEEKKLSIKAQTQSCLQLDKGGKYSQVIFDKIIA